MWDLIELVVPYFRRDKMYMQICSVVILFTEITLAQLPIDCNFAPPEMQVFCMQLVNLDLLSRRQIQFLQQNEGQLQAPTVPDMPWMSPRVPDQSFAPTPLDCMDLLCLCPYLHGRVSGGVCILPNGTPLQRAVRKEYRMLTDAERNRYHNAIRRLKSSGDYDRLSSIHQQAAVSSGAHSGPAFLPWHREYTKRIEIALRLIDPSLAIPYWDSIMDSYLPNPRDSIIWSPLFAGETDNFGNVITGPYAGFRTLEGRPAVTRRLGAEGRLFSESDLINLLNQRDISSVLAFTAPQAGCPFPPNYRAVEYVHGSVHLWVGGDMKPVVRASNDPIFFPHHSFVDYIWELYRQNRQNSWEREQAYPPELIQCANPMHFKNSMMFPFHKRNGDGLSNAYTNNLYVYAPRPTCNMQQRTCGSPYLFCDVRHGAPHCVSKIKPNGLCVGFEEEDACYRGICLNTFCRPGAMTQPSQEVAITSFPSNNQHHNSSNSRRSILAGVMTETCFNDDPCCSIWAARQDCVRNKPFMSRFCKRSCGICKSKLGDRTACIDRHISCAYFRSKGDCVGRRQWMAENCRKSCGWCNIPLNRICSAVARMSRM